MCFSLCWRRAHNVLQHDHATGTIEECKKVFKITTTTSSQHVCHYIITYINTFYPQPCLIFTDRVPPGAPGRTEDQTSESAPCSRCPYPHRFIPNPSTSKPLLVSAYTVITIESLKWSAIIWWGASSSSLSEILVLYASYTCILTPEDKTSAFVQQLCRCLWEKCLQSPEWTQNSCPCYRPAGSTVCSEPMITSQSWCS